MEFTALAIFNGTIKRVPCHSVHTLSFNQIPANIWRSNNLCTHSSNEFISCTDLTGMGGYQDHSPCSSPQSPVSISDKRSYQKISYSLEATRFVSRIFQSLWNLTGTSAALLPMWLSNFKAMRRFKLSIPRLRDFTRSYYKTSYWILKRGPGLVPQKIIVLVNI